MTASRSSLNSGAPEDLGVSASAVADWLALAEHGASEARKLGLAPVGWDNDN